MYTHIPLVTSNEQLTSVIIMNILFRIYESLK